MENSVKGPEVYGIVEKSRSFDLQSFCREKLKSSTRNDGTGELKRKQKPSASEELGLGQSTKRSRKEVPLSSFECINKKSKTIANAFDGSNSDRHVLDSKDSAKKTNDQVFGEGKSKNVSGLTDILPNLDANVVPIPKRPRCFTRRKKVQNNHLSQPDASAKLSSDAQLVKLSGQPFTQVLSPEGNPKTNDDGSKENSFLGRVNSARSLKGKDSASLRYAEASSKIARRNHGKTWESKPQEHTVVDRVDSSVNRIAKSENLQEDDEENLEENAARMLSSRFDPSCTVFSGNGMTSAPQSVNGSSICGNTSVQSNYSGNLEAGDADAEGRVLRPRRKDNHNTRKRRHFYEIFSRDVDPYWVINRRIKILWPLDQSWYFGLLTSYDPQRKLHHIKYDDREEEWINLEHERFKILLLPSEVPCKPDSVKLAPISRSAAEDKGDIALEYGSSVDGYLESEPLVTWLDRSTRRVKSSLLDVKKKRKMSSQFQSIETPLLSEDSVSTSTDHLFDGPSRVDANKLCSTYVVPDKPDDKEINKVRCSNDATQRVVYFRKRFRQRGQGWGSTSDSSECRDIVVYDPHNFCAGKIKQLKKHTMAHQCLGLENLDLGCVFWSGENLGSLKLTVSPMKSRQVTLRLSSQLQFAYHAVGAENFRMCHTLVLLKYGIVMVMWPKVQLEMLFVDNVVGLRFLVFEGCLMQAVAFVFLVLAAFHQPKVSRTLLDQQIPVTSIRFEISGFPSSRRRFIFVLYNFVEVKTSKWLYLDNKLKHYCVVTKQLPLSECTYDNIKRLQSQSSLSPSPYVCREPVSNEGPSKWSRQGFMHKRIAIESAYVNMSLSSSSCERKGNRVPQFCLPFAAAPTFFLSLHLKLLMAQNLAAISFCNPSLLLECPQDCNKSVADDGFPVEDLSEQITLDNDMECSLSRTAAVPGFLSSAESDVGADIVSMGNEGDWATTSQKCQNGNHSVVEGSLDVQDSWPSVGECHSSQEKCDTEFLSRLKGINVEIPTSNQVESQSCDGEVQGAQQSTIDSVWSVNDCAVSSPNPTAPRSIWHRNKHNSGSLSFGYRSKMWPDEGVEYSHNGLVNGSRKPRSQISYLLPFGNYDFSSKPRSHHRKGRPYKRMRTDSEKAVSNGLGSPQRRLELLSCDANLLIIVGDRGWRECGANVVLESIDHNEWRLLVKVSEITKYSYKAYQFLQPGTTNRYTHAMMWKGGKDWTLEFPDRSQWAIFKEMHEECYNRNLRAAFIKTIPIPGVCLIEEIDDNGVEVPFVRSSPKYFLQVETDVDMALNPSRVLYDMDSDDEEWLSKRRDSSDASVSSPMEISEEMFERTMDMFEKVAYSQQREDFKGDEIKELMGGGIPFDLIKGIYEHWKKKRRTKGMPLIRQLQPSLWERYQQQLKEWELSVNKMHHLPNGCKEKVMLLEKPPMFAFCLRPRGLEVPNKGSKQRSQRKVLAGGFSRDSDGHHVFGRKSNGFVYGDERFPSSSNHEHASSWQISTRVISPRDAVSSGYMSMSSDGSERSQHRTLHRSKSKKLGAFVPNNDSRMTATSYNQRLVTNRNGVSKWNVCTPDWPNQQQHQYQYQHQREGYQRQRVEKFGGPDYEFKLRDASGAAQHASNMAKLKREKAHRLLYKADLAVHKAMVALITAENIKASSQDPTEDG